MSSAYKGLDDILTALRNTSVLGLPSGEYLMCFLPNLLLQAEWHKTFDCIESS